MTAHKPGDPTTLNRLYGRSVGKPLRKGQQAPLQVLVDGKEVETLAGHLDLRRPLAREPGWVE